MRGPAASENLHIDASISFSLCCPWHDRPPGAHGTWGRASGSGKGSVGGEDRAVCRSGSSCAPGLLLLRRQPVAPRAHTEHTSPPGPDAQPFPSPRQTAWHARSPGSGGNLAGRRLNIYRCAEWFIVLLVRPVADTHTDSSLHGCVIHADPPCTRGRHTGKRWAVKYKLGFPGLTCQGHLTCSPSSWVLFLGHRPGPAGQGESWAEEEGAGSEETPSGVSGC